MKYLLSLLVLIIISPLLSDLINWSIYNQNIAHELSTSSKLKHKGDGVKVYSNNNFNIFIFDPKKVKFGVSESRPRDKKFYMNSNFFNENPIGLVVVDGIKVSSRVKGGGYFYVSGNKVNVKRGGIPKQTDYASQTILWGIDNGVVNKSLLKQRHSKHLTYRNIVGKNKNNDIIFIVSKLEQNLLM